MSGSLLQMMNFLTNPQTIESMNAIPKTAFDLAMLLVKARDYSLALTYFQVSLRSLGFSLHGSPDYILKSKCYTQIGHCYRQLKQYDEALKNYSMALSNNVSLPFNGHAKILTSIGYTLELSHQFETALSKYIEVAEMYQKHANETDSSDVKFIEERIKHVLSHIFPPDK